MKRLATLLTLLAVVLAAAPAAWGHGDTGTLELLEAEPAGGTDVRYVVQLTYRDDGDPVPSAVVRVATDAAEPAPMAVDGGGRYSATVTFPDAGEHAVRFSADDPTATLDHLQVVSSTDTTASTASTATTDAPGDDPVIADEPLPDDGEGSSAWLLVLMAIIATAMVVLAVAFVRGRRPPSAER